MKSTGEYLDILKRFKDTNAEKYGIKRLGIFGSVARGEQKEGSDVDICFESTPMGLFALCQLKEELEKLLDCTVDLLRMRKQLEGTSLKESITEDVLYV